MATFRKAKSAFGRRTKRRDYHMRILLTSLVLASSLAASPALAQPGAEEFSVSIAYGDLDVASDAGANVLLHRVKARADQFCGGAGDSPLQQTLQVQTCRAKFIQAAEQKMQLADSGSSAVRLGGR